MKISSGIDIAKIIIVPKIHKASKNAVVFASKWHDFPTDHPQVGRDALSAHSFLTIKSHKYADKK